MPLLTKGDNTHLSLHRFPIPNKEDVDANLYKTKFVWGGDTLKYQGLISRGNPQWARETSAVFSG